MKRIIYHGSQNIIEVPEFGKGNPFNDYGLGFYCTENQELAKVINAFIDELPEHEQKIFVCRYWYFDSISTISVRFGFSESKVKSMLHRTRKRLRSKLSEEGVIIGN